MPVSLLLEDALRAPGVMIYPGKFYVYEWLSENGECLYVGKGSGRRAWQFDRAELQARMAGEHPAHARLLLWVDLEKDAFDYEWQLIGIRSPKWNLLGLLYSTDGRIRERSRCRQVIVQTGIRPFVKNGLWDRMTCMRPSGTSCMPSLNMLRQIRKMAAEGYWGVFRIDRKLWPGFADIDDETHVLR